MAKKIAGASKRMARKQALLFAWEARQDGCANDHSDIAKQLKLDPRTVAFWFKKFDKGDFSCEDAPRSGRKRSLDTADYRKIGRHLKGATTNTIASATRLVNKGKAEDKTVCARTVRRAVKRAFKDVLVYDAVKRQAVSKTNARLRLAATTPSRRAKVQRQLNQIVFLDAAIVRWKKGARIQAFRIQKAWNDKDCPRQQNLAAKKQFMFYSAITLGPKRELERHPLIFVPPGKGLDARCFVQKVAKPVHRWATQTVFGHNQCVFAQDNATCHTAASTKEWMAKKGYQLHEHPAQSPDLNRIEKAWAYFKRKLEVRAPRSEERLKVVMEEVWQGLDASVLKGFILELPDVMKKVHEQPKKHVKA